MNEHQYRFDIEVLIRPGCRQRVVGGGAVQLVTIHLFDGPGVVDCLTGEPIASEGAFTNLTPPDARLLATKLLACAAEADRMRVEASR
jgi:hypothetical protein